MPSIGMKLDVVVKEEEDTDDDDDNDAGCSFFSK